MFKVGDKVVLKTPGIGNVRVGTVKSITPKFNNIIVDFGSYKQTFTSNGELKNREGYFLDGKIAPLTSKIEQQLLEASTINKYRVLLENKLTYDEAVQIINILEKNDEL